MFALGVALLIGGYGIAYYGLGNMRSGGQGPSFQETFGLKTAVSGPTVSTTVSPNLTGQPPATAASPSGGVWV